MWGSLVTLGLATFGLYFIYKRLLSGSKNKFWEKYGVRHVDASTAASSLDILLGKKDLSDRDCYAYNLLSRTGDKYGGMIENFDKVLLVRDVELIKKILIKDFEHFPTRRDFVEWAADDNILRKMMPSATGDEWKSLRNTLTPAFTTGKIRKMMEYFNIVGKEWADTLKSKAKATGSVKIDVLNSTNTYTVDVIAASVFGMKAGTIKNPNSEFSKKAFRLVDLNVYKTILGFLLPKLAKFLAIEVFDVEALTYFEKILNQGLQARLKEKKRHNDFIQMLIDAQKGELKAAGVDELDEFEKDAQVKSDKKIQLTDEILNAQSLMFFIAGFSTTTNFITFALYALAAHKESQEKLKKELDGIVKGDGDFDYDELAQLPYLDMVVNEVLRMYPPALRLERICMKDYHDPETGLKVPKGALVAIPVKALHYDPEHYPNPEKFDPEGHFSPENKMGRNPYVFLPFGSGPRNCIGMRFALIEGKAAIAHIVHSFLIEPTDKTPLPVTGMPGAIQMLPPKGLELKLTPRK